MYDSNRFEPFIDQETTYIQDNFLPYMESMLPTYDLIDRSETAERFQDAPYGSYPLPEKDVTESSSTFYCVYEADLEGCVFHDTFSPQYFFVDEDEPGQAEEDGKYGIAVEHRGTFTVEAQDDTLRNVAHLIADQWKDEVALIWEGCAVDQFDYVLDEL